MSRKSALPDSARINFVQKGKFADSCVYTHHILKEESHYMKLVTTVRTLENKVKKMCVKISDLAKELENRIIKEAFLE